MTGLLILTALGFLRWNFKRRLYFTVLSFADLNEKYFGITFLNGCFLNFERPDSLPCAVIHADAVERPMLGLCRRSHIGDGEAESYFLASSGASAIEAMR